MKARLPQGMTGNNRGNMNGMIKQAQKMQAEITQLQEDIEQREFSAQAGGGMVSVTMSGSKHINSLEIKPEAVDPNDVEMLQDMIISAVNECVGNIEKVSEEEMGAITGGVSFPGLF